MSIYQECPFGFQLPTQDIFCFHAFAGDVLGVGGVVWLGGMGGGGVGAV